MTGRVVTLTPGALLVFDGDLVKVLALDGTRVVLRNNRTAGMLTVGLARLVTTASSGR